MAYTFASASSQYLSAASCPLGTGQLGNHAIAFWTNAAAASPTTTPFSMSRSTETTGTNNPAILIQNINGAVGYFMRANSSPTASGWNGVSGAAISGGTAFDSTWHHVCCTLSGTVSTIYVDGASVATNTASSVPTQTGMDRLGIGALVRGNVVNYFSGTMADLGVWTVALTADEIGSLAKAASCRLIRPQSLVFYAPLIRDLIDYKGGRTITNNGAATVASHPRVYA